MKQLLDFKLLVSGKLSNSMNIKLFEWYKPHCLHDSPEPTAADQREVKGKSNYKNLKCNAFPFQGANPNIHREGVSKCKISAHPLKLCKSE